MHRRRNDERRFIQDNLKAFLVTTVETAGDLDKDDVEVVSRDDRVLSAVAKTAIRAHELRRDAHHDPLTGLLNRSGFAAAIGRLSPDGSYAVGNIDMREMKAVNDENNHAAGDEYVKGTASAVVTNLRFDAIVARVGGDEMSIVVPVEDEDGVRRIEQRLRQVLGGNGVGAVCRLNDEISTRVSARVAFVISDKANIEVALRETDTMLGELKDAEEKAHPKSQRGERGFKEYIDNKTGEVFVKAKTE